MDFYNHLFFILMIIFLASFMRSCFGFGDALVAMPLLILLMPAKTAAPLLCLVELSISCAILYSRWREIAFKQLSQLLFAAFLGIPFGIYFLKYASDQFIRPLLAIVILVFVIFNFTLKNKFLIKNKSLAWPAGMLSGFFGGVANISGPPIVVYASLKGWNPRVFMATLQGHFFVTGLFISLGHGISGLWEKKMWATWLFSLPIIIVASILGKKLHEKISPDKFYLIINILLVILALVILIQSIGVYL